MWAGLAVEEKSFLVLFSKENRLLHASGEMQGCPFAIDAVGCPR
jgi:hypothetical protein